MAMKGVGFRPPPLSLDVDVPLFIDPVLLEKSSNKTINTTAIGRFRKHFEIMVRMLTISKAEDDAAWKAARRQLDLSDGSDLSSHFKHDPLDGAPG